MAPAAPRSLEATRLRFRPKITRPDDVTAREGGGGGADTQVGGGRGQHGRTTCVRSVRPASTPISAPPCPAGPAPTLALPHQPPVPCEVPTRGWAGGPGGGSQKPPGWLVCCAVPRGNRSGQVLRWGQGPVLRLFRSVRAHRGQVGPLVGGWAPGNMSQGFQTALNRR